MKPSEAHQVSVNSQPTVHKHCDIQTIEIHFLIQIKTSNWIHCFLSTCTLFVQVRIGTYDLLGKFSLYLSIHLHVWNLFKFLHPSQNPVNISVMTLIHLSVMKWGAPQFLKISSQKLNFTKPFYGHSHKSPSKFMHYKLTHHSMYTTVFPRLYELTLRMRFPLC